MLNLGNLGLIEQYFEPSALQSIETAMEESLPAEEPKESNTQAADTSTRNSLPRTIREEEKIETQINLANSIFVSESTTIRNEIRKKLIESSICYFEGNSLKYQSDHDARSITARINAFKAQYAKDFLSLYAEVTHETVDKEVNSIIDTLISMDGEKEITDVKKEKLQEYLEECLKKFKEIYATMDYDQQKKYRHAYLLMHTLSNFDSYVENLGDIVSPKYAVVDGFFSTTYKYAGPKSHHLTGYNREDSPAAEILGTLQKTVLDYLPKVDRLGNPIIGTSVSWNGFLTAGLMLRNWAQSLGFTKEAYKDIYAESLKDLGQID